MFLSVLTFLIFLSILVLVHELGHFLAARRAGVWVEEFGFGIPPRIWGKKFGETVYSINLFPFGGFVKLHGESSDDLLTKPERAFLNKSPKVRTGIIMAGVVMNFLLAILSFSFVYSFSGVPRKIGSIKVVEIREGSPAASAGLQNGDFIKTLDGKTVTSNKEFISLVEAKKGEEVILEVERRDSLTEIKITPRENPPQGEGSLGVLISDSEIHFPPLWQRPFYGVYYGFKEAIFWGGVVIVGFAGIIGDLFLGVFPKDVAGPAGLFVLTSEVAKVGILPLVNWLGIISVNLAILNIFPFPALDGGQLIFIAFEKVFGRRVLPKIQTWVQAIGLGLLVFFLLVVTFREVNLITSLGIQGYLDFLTKSQVSR